MEIKYNHSFSEFKESGYIVFRKKKEVIEILFICYDIVDADNFVAKMKSKKDGFLYYWSDEIDIR